MSSIVNTKNLVEERLSGIQPALPIAWENVQFTPPIDGSKYLRCILRVLSPTDDIIQENYSRQVIYMTVLVLDRLNIGTVGAIETAEVVKELFKKTTTLVKSDVQVRILSTPYIGSAVITDDRLVIPVEVELTVENLQ